MATNDALSDRLNKANEFFRTEIRDLNLLSSVIDDKATLDDVLNEPQVLYRDGEGLSPLMWYPMPNNDFEFADMDSGLVVSSWGIYMLDHRNEWDRTAIDLIEDGLTYEKAIWICRKHNLALLGAIKQFRELGFFKQ